MRKQWTELQLLLVFYFLKYGNTHGIKDKIIPFSDYVKLTGHSNSSFWTTYNKFANRLNFKPNPAYEIYQTTLKMEDVIDRFGTYTTSQLRTYISNLIVKANSKESSNQSGTNVSKEKDNVLNRSKTNIQLTFDFDGYDEEE
jgi:hypothetical protein